MISVELLNDKIRLLKEWFWKPSDVLGVMARDKHVTSLESLVVIICNLLNQSRWYLLNCWLRFIIRNYFSKWSCRGRGADVALSNISIFNRPDIEATWEHVRDSLKTGWDETQGYSCSPIIAEDTRWSPALLAPIWPIKCHGSTCWNVYADAERDREHSYNPTFKMVKIVLAGGAGSKLWIVWRVWKLGADAIVDVGREVLEALLAEGKHEIKVFSRKVSPSESGRSFFVPNNCWYSNRKFQTYPRKELQSTLWIIQTKQHLWMHSRESIRFSRSSLHLMIPIINLK